MLLLSDVKNMFKMSFSLIPVDLDMSLVALWLKLLDKNGNGPFVALPYWVPLLSSSSYFSSKIPLEVKVKVMIT